jgi:hypothetical protein
VAILNQQLLAPRRTGRHFRWKDYRATGKTRYKTMTRGVDEFMRGSPLHVLPDGFHRVRREGCWPSAADSHTAAAKQAAAPRALVNLDRTIESPVMAHP